MGFGVYVGPGTNTLQIPGDSCVISLSTVGLPLWAIQKNRINIHWPVSTLIPKFAFKVVQQVVKIEISGDCHFKDKFDTLAF